MFIIIGLICMIIYYRGKNPCLEPLDANNKIKGYQTIINDLKLHIGALNDSLGHYKDSLVKVNSNLDNLKIKIENVKKNDYSNISNDSLSIEVSGFIRDVIKGGKN